MELVGCVTSRRDFLGTRDVEERVVEPNDLLYCTGMDSVWRGLAGFFFFFVLSCAHSRFAFDSDVGAIVRRFRTSFSCRRIVV